MLMLTTLCVKYNQFQFRMFSVTSMEGYLNCLGYNLFCDCTLNLARSPVKSIKQQQSRITYRLSKSFNGPFIYPNGPNLFINGP